MEMGDGRELADGVPFLCSLLWLLHVTLPEESLVPSEPAASLVMPGLTPPFPYSLFPSMFCYEDFQKHTGKLKEFHNEQL